MKTLPCLHSNMHLRRISKCPHPACEVHCFIPLHVCTTLLDTLYAGENESSALLKEINKQKGIRPLTHDLTKNLLSAVGFHVTKIRITELVRHTHQLACGGWECLPHYTVVLNRGAPTQYGAMASNPLRWLMDW